MIEGKNEGKNEALGGTSIPGSKILRVSATFAAILVATYLVFFQLF